MYTLLSVAKKLPDFHFNKTLLRYLWCWLLLLLLFRLTDSFPFTAFDVIFHHSVSYYHVYLLGIYPFCTITEWFAKLPPPVFLVFHFVFSFRQVFVPQTRRFTPKYFLPYALYFSLHDTKSIATRIFFYICFHGVFSFRTPHAFKPLIFWLQIPLFTKCCSKLQSIQ